MSGVNILRAVRGHRRCRAATAPERDAHVNTWAGLGSEWAIVLGVLWTGIDFTGVRPEMESTVACMTTIRPSRSMASVVGRLMMRRPQQQLDRGAIWAGVMLGGRRGDERHPYDQEIASGHNLAFDGKVCIPCGPPPRSIASSGDAAFDPHSQSPPVHIARGSRCSYQALPKTLVARGQ